MRRTTGCSVDGRESGFPGARRRITGCMGDYPSSAAAVLQLREDGFLHRAAFRGNLDQLAEATLDDDVGVFEPVTGERADDGAALSDLSARDVPQRAAH